MGGGVLPTQHLTRSPPSLWLFITSLYRNGYKLFADSDVARVRFVRQAQSLGYTLKEIAQVFEESLRGKSPCPRVREIIKRPIKENQDKLDTLVQLQTRMEQALAQWSKMSDGVPDGNTVCHLIESIAHHGYDSK